MALRPPSARVGAAAICAALVSCVLPSTALAQEQAWAPLRHAKAALSPKSLGGPMHGGEPALPVGETPPNKVPRTFDLPAARPLTPTSEDDFRPQFANPGPMDMADGYPPAAQPPGGEADRRWISLLKQPARTPWLAQPLSFSKFAGGYGSEEPIEDRLGAGIGLVTGVRTCWDFAPRWGVESRLGFARTSLGSPGPGQLASHENFWFWDAEFVFYPWPDTLWRPFIFAGSGMTDVRYIDDAGRWLHQSLFHIPLGFGVKRQIYGEHAFRIDISDNLLFTDTRPREYIHGISIVAGFEFRFGGRWKWLNALPTD